MPRAQITAATTLSSVSVNLALVVGPAVAGVLIARSGVPVVFGLGYGDVPGVRLGRGSWHPRETTRPYRPEPFIAALRAGAYMSGTRRWCVLLRSALFLVPASARAAPSVGYSAPRPGSEWLWTAARRPGAGWLLFRLGGRVRAGSRDQLLVAASAVYAAVLVVVVFVVGNAAVRVSNTN